MDRIVDIATDGLHLSIHRGFLLVRRDQTEVGRIALDDIHAVLVHAHGTTWSSNLVGSLAERGAPIVFCGANNVPVAVTLPLDGHYAQNARMRAQIGASRPLMKQLWRRVVAAKIIMQGSLLAARGINGAEAFSFIAQRVRSGDPDNLEAQRFTRLIAFDLRLGGERSPVSVVAQRMAAALARAFETGRAEFPVFEPPTAMEWAEAGRVEDETDV